MQQNEVYTLYKNYTSDIMQALKEKIDENKKLKEKININEKEIDSLKNQNKTWKIKLQIINASKISETYEPAGWSFMDSSKSED